ncbi:hypothetical protein AMJ52_09835 [candidate division TA06 bacterium DG_78]|uniref:Secretion system C-terminal sorting domain-containing protein n=1 Tax=candidate division TA06 bacterium DG_78 TaxID=1703772 RepID=A0A0S7Y7C4_UNCT6|nr:MAG: hypothetical protein AMJ52_09835 [candidate division TA06 bacterium DG_78]
MNRLIVITVFVVVMPVSLCAQINWTEHTVDSTFTNANEVDAADVDGDEDMDIIGAASTDDDITWWENTDGVGTNWIEHTVDDNFDGAKSVHAADIDGDEDIDILGAARQADDIAWWENLDGTGTSWTKHVVETVFDGASSVYTADVDGDGYMDLIGAADDGDNITWWENTDGSGTNWIEHVVTGSFSRAFSVCVSDINGDEYTDVLAVSASANVTWWENTDGAGTSWTAHTIGSFSGPRSVCAADIDDDGDMDAVAAAYTADDITWWENTDSIGTSWTEHTINGDFNGAWAVYAADIDGDGDIDVLGTALEADDITWWENIDGTGTNWTEHTIKGDYNGARAVYAADIDGDAVMDIIGAAWYANSITWWESDMQGIHDVGIVSIDIPLTLPLDTTLYPQVTVTNPGTITKPFNVMCEIDPGAYVSTDSVYDLTPKHSMQITFPDSFTFESGFYTITAYTVLVGDENPTNDTLEEVVEATSIAESNPIIPLNVTIHTPTISTGKTKIEFTLPEATNVDLLVYDAIGRLRRTLISDRFSAGTHTLHIDLNLSAGVYFYNLKTESGTITKKFLRVE